MITKSGLSTAILGASILAKALALALAKIDKTHIPRLPSNDAVAALHQALSRMPTVISEQEFLDRITAAKKAREIPH